MHFLALLFFVLISSLYSMDDCEKLLGSSDMIMSETTLTALREKFKEGSIIFSTTSHAEGIRYRLRSMEPGVFDFAVDMPSKKTRYWVYGTNIKITAQYRDSLFKLCKEFSLNDIDRYEIAAQGLLELAKATSGQ